MIGPWKNDDAFFKQLIDGAHEGVLVTDPSGVTLYVNDRLLEMLEREREEVVGRHFIEFIPKEHRDAARERLRVRAEGAKTQSESVYLKKSEELLYVTITGNPLFHDGKIVGVAGFFTDITQRKKAENELSRLSKDLERMVREREADLRRSQRELQSFFEATSLMMGIIELVDGRLKHVIDNPAYCNWVKVKPGETSGKFADDLHADVPDINSWLEVCQRSLKIKGPVLSEFVDKTGLEPKYFTAHTNYIGLSPEGFPRFSYVAEDVTEKKELERKKVEHMAHINHLSKMSALGEMASGIAHEVYNPLTIIRGYADLIVRKSQHGVMDSNELERLASEIKETCKRITSIVEGLRFFAREGSQDPMDLVFVEELVETTTRICSERLKRHGVHLEVLHETPLLKVFCRGVQISQVILNLLNNAFDAVQNQEFKKISIHTRINEAFVMIEVEDNGPGIPEDIQHRVFEPFFTTKPVGLGTGMGLSICKGIMDAHSGSIRLNSSSHGTCFQLALPHGTGRT